MCEAKANRFALYINVLMDVPFNTPGSGVLGIKLGGLNIRYMMA